MPPTKPPPADLSRPIPMHVPQSPFPASEASSIVRDAQPASRPARAPDDIPQRPARHVMRPIAEYQEYEEENRLHIPKHMIPDGFDLQWVTDSVWGRQETRHRARFERQGWVPVLCEDEIGCPLASLFMPASAQGEINVDGLVLMARPMAWSNKAKSMDQRRAFERVSIKERQMLSGDLSGITLAADHPTAVRSNIINRSLDTVSIPQK